MITRNDYDTGTPADHDDLTPRQRSPRTDPDMRDGDSGRGNPLESGPDPLTTDNDVGDTHPTAGADPTLDDLPNVSAAPAAESSAPPDDAAELDRSREEVVGAGMVEPHGPAAAERTGASAGGRAGPSAAHRDEPPRAGRPADPGMPLAGYPDLTVPEIIRQAGSMSIDQLRAVKDYEKSHRRRKTLLTKLERLLRNPGGAGKGGQSDSRSGPADHNPHRP